MALPSSESILQWVVSEIHAVSSSIELDYQPSITVTFPPDLESPPLTAAQGDGNGQRGIIHLAILRPSCSVDNSQIAQSSPLPGLVETLNALHSIAKSGAKACVLVVRVEDIAVPSAPLPSAPLQSATVSSTTPKHHKVSSVVVKALHHLGLFAMEYGGVYVGSARFATPFPEHPDSNFALDDNSRTAVHRVIRESLQFRGASSSVIRIGLSLTLYTGLASLTLNPKPCRYYTVCIVVVSL